MMGVPYRQHTRGPFKRVKTRKPWTCGSGVAAGCRREYEAGTHCWHRSDWILGGQVYRFCETCWEALREHSKAYNEGRGMPRPLP